MRPPSLQVVRFFPARAQRRQFVEGGGDKGPRGVGGGAAVEEGVDVCGGDVDDGAEGGGVLLEDVHGFGGGDGAGVAGGGEGGFGLAEEGGQGVGGAEVVEDGFVANDDHFYGAVVAVRPFDDGADLFGRDGDAGVGDEDTQDEF